MPTSLPNRVGRSVSQGKPSGPAEGSPKGDLDGLEADAIMWTSPEATFLRILGGAANTWSATRWWEAWADAAIQLSRQEA
jgi:hypothetical protein